MLPLLDKVFKEVPVCRRKVAAFGTTNSCHPSLWVGCSIHLEFSRLSALLDWRQRRRKVCLVGFGCRVSSPLKSSKCMTLHCALRDIQPEADCGSKKTSRGASRVLATLCCMFHISYFERFCVELLPRLAQLVAHRTVRFAHSRQLYFAFRMVVFHLLLLGLGISRADASTSFVIAKIWKSRLEIRSPSLKGSLHPNQLKFVFSSNS